MSDFTAATAIDATCPCGGALYVDEEREQRVGRLAVIRCTSCCRREGRMASFGFGARRHPIRGGEIVVEAMGRVRDARRAA